MKIELSLEEEQRIFQRYNALIVEHSSHDEVVRLLKSAPGFELPTPIMNEVLLKCGVSPSRSVYYSSKIYCYVSDEEGLSPYFYCIHLKRDIFLREESLRKLLDDALGEGKFEYFFNSNPDSRYIFEVCSDRQSGDALIANLQELGFVYFDILV